MGASTAEILRQQLREKFPQAHGMRVISAHPAVPGEPLEQGSFPAGAISEVIPAGPSAGLLLLVAGLLGDPEESSSHPELVLVDGSDAFDPASFTGHACSRLLWVRCGSAMEMIKAADLLIHDGNLPFILLDATGLARRDLASVPASAWLRMKHAAARNGGHVVVLAPFPIVPCAAKRLTLSAGLSLHDFDSPRHELLPRLQTKGEELRRAT